MATTCLAGSGFAADLPSRKAPPPAPYISPAPVASWTGFYVGVNAGGAFKGSSTIVLTPSSDFGPFPSGFASAQAIGAYPTALTSRRTSFIGGGQAGFNYQFGMFVAGFEADIQGLPQRNAVSATLFNPTPPPANFAAPVFGTATVARRLDYPGTARGRLGVAFGTVVLTGASSTSRTSLGYTLGGGVEYAFWNNWSVKAEYLYYNLGRHWTIIGGSFTNFAPATGASRQRRCATTVTSFAPD